MLTDRERQIVDLLRRDPLMKAAALAAAVGTSRASINVHLSNLGKKGVILGRGYVLAEQPGAVVIGGANVDLKARSSARATDHTSNPGHGSMAPGGVARNIAENIARLGDRVHLISVVGRDPMGDNLLEHTAAAGVRIEHVTRTDRPTGTYTAVFDVDGELIVAIADMEATAELGPEQLHHARDIIATAGVLVLDGNLGLDTLNYALDLSAGVYTVFEPVSVPKAAGLEEAIDASASRRSPPTATNSPHSPTCRPAPTGRCARRHEPCTPAASNSSGSGWVSGDRYSAPPTAPSRSRRHQPPWRTSPARATRCSARSATCCSPAAHPKRLLDSATPPLR